MDEKESLISEPYINNKGHFVRKVGGVEVIQIEEKSEREIALNRNINLWRLRDK